MSYKWLGAILIIAGCGGTGASMIAYHKRDEHFLKYLIHVLQYMECELQYRLTPLPELCRTSAGEVKGALSTVLLNLAREMDWQIIPDVDGCMASAMRKSNDLSPKMRIYLHKLGQAIGRFDLPGQLAELQALKAACESDLKQMQENSAIRHRNYQTLWLCAGAALVILFL